MQQFHKVLANTLIANVTTSFLWFALTFWVYLETRSVLATAIVGGSYMLCVAVFSLVFGTIVDRHKKKQVMVGATAVTLVAYVLAGLLYAVSSKSALVDFGSPLFWVFALVILLGGVVENMRNIALSTTVTLLVPADRRDKANGLVGSVQGVAFITTSIFSGLAIGFLGMGWTLVIAIALTAVALAHMTTVDIPEEGVAHDPELANKRIDIRGSLAAIRAVPALLALILFTTFNNLLGGVYMALMDPYGLTLFSVQAWGILLGLVSTGFIIGGLVVAQKGLGKNPIRTMLIANIVISGAGAVFAIRELWWLYLAGTFVYMCLIPVIEAAEQTTIQKVVPFERQGRVFGFAQSIESASAPITAFAIGPLAQFLVLPHVASPAGREQFGWLLGAGEARGIALIFVITGLIGVAISCLAFASRSYRQIRQHVTSV